MQYQIALAIVTIILLGAWFVLLRKKRNFWKIAVINTILTYILAASFPYVSLRLSIRSVIILYDAIILIVVVATDRLIAYNKKMAEEGEEDARQAIEVTADSTVVAAIDENVSLKQELRTSEPEFINKTEITGTLSSDDKVNISPQSQDQDYEPDKEIEQIIDEAVAEIIAEKEYVSTVNADAAALDKADKPFAQISEDAEKTESMLMEENKTEQEPSLDIKEENIEVKVQPEEAKAPLQLEPKEDSLITKIETDVSGIEGEETPLQAEALSGKQDSEKPCECKDVLEQAEESGIEDKEADIAEVAEGIQTSLAALDIQEEIISG
ncbi:MAG: hypothetical protein LBK69_04580, partial [Syntrophomonadaceae bacterium]|nr:hypothetical protein [Syntrophomonadaceae bacterium]